ncbi:MAG: hypothetical protein GY711_09580 [bacterium]|nr:hypothetical protein [bacterium]
MDLKAYDILVGIAVLAWNLTITRTPCEHHLAEVFESLDDGEARFLRALLAELSERKERLFPHDDRFIVSWDTSPTPTGFYLQVASMQDG